MLLGAVLDRPFAFGHAQVLGLEVEPDAAEGLVAHGVPVLQVAVGLAADQAVVRGHLRAVPLGRFPADGLAAAEDEHELPVVGVVDGDVPVDGIAVAAGLARKRAQVGHDEIGDAQVLPVVPELPGGVDPHPELGKLHVDGRSHVRAEQAVGGGVAAAHHPGPVARAVPKVSVQERQVHRVDVAFVALEVVALVVDLADEDVVRGGVEELEIAQQWRLAAAEVGEDHARPFLAGIGGLAQGRPVPSAFGLAGLLQAVAVHVVEPAVVDAPQPAVLHPPVAQVGAPVAAMDAQEAGPAPVVAEQHQVLAQDAHRQGRASRRQLFGQRHGLPVTPQQRAAGRARLRGGQQPVLFGGHHGAFTPRTVSFRSRFRAAQDGSASPLPDREAHGAAHVGR